MSAPPEIESLLKSGDLPGALSAVKAAIRKAPADSDLRFTLFQVLSASGDWESASNQLVALSELTEGLNEITGWALLDLSEAGARALYETIITMTLSFMVFTFGSLIVAIQVASGQMTPRVIATTPAQRRTASARRARAASRTGRSWISYTSGGKRRASADGLVSRNSVHGSRE